VSISNSIPWAVIDCVAALKRIMVTEGMELEIIINPKTNDDGQAVVQVCAR
jgi:hypothetical protein